MRVSIRVFQRLHGESAFGGRAGKSVCARAWGGRRAGLSGQWRAGKWLVMLVLAAMAAVLLAAQQTSAAQGAGAAAAERSNLPPQVVQAERFLAQRGWTRGRRQAWAGTGHRGRSAAVARSQTQAQGQGSATWQPLGPTAVQSENFGLVTGRISALALDPSDGTGNILYVGATGGGVWRSQNAGTSSPANIRFTPLTDGLSAMSGVEDASISIGALTVQPGGTGVILAGTGDPNDALDSYYGAGILRSTDGGVTWSLIPSASIAVSGIYSFAGEGFAGFAWSTVNPQLVVAAVSQAYDGTLVNAVRYGSSTGGSYEGLYYSSDSGATWSLATITDGAGEDVQGPNDLFDAPDGNAATSVVWNPVRQLFVAAVRFHGYYQSSDGITWTRMANQPGAGLASSAELCPTDSGGTGSPGCPIFRGALAVNPETGDTFAWTVDEYNQDQGIWQDVCSASGGGCVSPTIAFAQQLSTTALETGPPLYPSGTIANGDYNFALAAIPSGQETILLAGANDLWKCTLTDNTSSGCAWRNTTNSTAGFCAGVGEYQHSLAWNPANPLEIFIGNDSGLWRSLDAVGETGAVCSASDATHFQNLNGSLGSLAEVESISQAGATPYTMMAGLGANGTAGVSSSAGPTTDWPEILGGEGGPVAIDPVDSNNWYVNNQAGVSIYLGAPPEGGTLGAFNPVLNITTDPGALTTSGADVVRDGLSMAEEPPYAPVAFLVDPLDNTQLLIGSCRVWRGPASGAGWSAANAVSPILDGVTGENNCSGNALIRSLAAMALPASATLPSGGEVVYVGMYGAADYGLANGGATLPGHVLSLTYNSATDSWSAPVDVTALNAVSNDTPQTMNSYGMEISSIFIDSHDPTGKTVYVTVAGFATPQENVQTVYGSTDGGGHWTDLVSNLPAAPANSLAVDPQSASTVYVATDAGVYATQQIASCNVENPGCWVPLGSGLPEAPVVALSAQPASAAAPALIAATYGRGIWMTPLLGAGVAGTGPATDTLSPASLNFPDTSAGQFSAAQYVTLTNSGSVDLTSIGVSVSGAFAIGASPQQTSVPTPCTTTLAPGSSCSIGVQFAPAAAGAQTGTLTVSDITRTQSQTVALSGTGLTPPAFGVSPASLTFTEQTAGQASAPQTLTVSNTGGAPMANVGFQIAGQSATSFSTGTTTCGATLSNVSGQNSCTVQVVFTPAMAGGSTASLVVSSSTSGVAPVTVSLIGTSQTQAGLNVSPAQLFFPIVAPGQSSPSQLVTITNSGGTTISPFALSVTGPFSLVQNTCGATLSNVSGQNSCTVGVVFSPSFNESYTGTLTVASSSLTLAVVLLNGRGGVPGSVEFQPSFVNFAGATGSTGIGVGQTSSAQTVTITNPDSVTSLQSLALAVSQGFLLVNNTCSSTLVPLASCTVGVEFAPTGTGTENGTLTVTDNVLAAGSTLALSGIGFDFALAANGSTTQTIANGQAADYTLEICGAGGCTLTPALGSQGAFTFQCGTLPSYMSCTFNPVSETVPAGVEGYVAVEISTGVSSSSARLSRSAAWPVLPLACGLALAPFALLRRRRRLLLIALLAILTGGVSSCASSGIISGGNSPVSGPGITPAGTYSIPVTATSNGVSHSITVTLTVD